MAESFREAQHLPNRRRPEQGHWDPWELPRQRRGKTPQMHGRYPDYDVLEQADHWDRQTREVVLGRLEPPPPRFFGEVELPTVRAFCDTVTAQDAEPRIPVERFVDEKLHEGRLDGFQFDGMPDDRDVWRIVARGLDEAARERGVESFPAAPAELRELICASFADGRLSGGAWDALNVSEAWSVVMRGVLASFYAHPWAWNEIGFGGPAYPRGYARMGVGLKESWEGTEAYELDPVQDVARRGEP
jgi:Gluconate 2-dehydrogenase subunit 3